MFKPALIMSFFTKHNNKMKIGSISFHELSFCYRIEWSIHFVIRRSLACMEHGGWCVRLLLPWPTPFITKRLNYLRKHMYNDFFILFFKITLSWTIIYTQILYFYQTKYICFSHSSVGFLLRMGVKTWMIISHISYSHSQV